MDDEVADEVGDPVEVGPVDAEALRAAYQRTDPIRRAGLWEGLSEPERDALTAAGYPSPVSVEVEDFQPVPPSDPSFGSATAQAHATLRAGMKSIRSGGLVVTDELRTEMGALLDAAEMYPPSHPSHYEAVQRGARLVEEAQRAAFDAIPFQGVQRSETYMGSDGVWRTKEYDNRGRARIRQGMSDVEVDAIRAARDEAANAPSFGDLSKIGPAELAAMPMPEYEKFRRQHPERVEALLRGWP